MPDGSVYLQILNYNSPFLKNIYNSSREIYVFENEVPLALNLRRFQAFCKPLTIKQLYDLILFKSFIDVKNARDLRQITLQSASSYGVI